MKLKPYPKYKDSGIKWIGEIPEGWEVGKLKFTLSKKRDSIKTGPFGSQLTIDEMYDHEYKVYNQKNVITKDETLGENYVSDEKFKELSAFKVSPGELLITTRGTIGKTLRLSKNAETGILHPCLMKINTNYEIIDNRFIEILLEESNIVSIQLFLQSNATTIDVIYQDNLKEVLLSLPPCPEQTTIAAFLDKKTAKIDSQIEKDKKLIALLKEKRTALINHVVTIGLDPNVKLKDSGIDWIGEIPEGWEVHKLKYKTIINKKKLEDDINPNYVINYLDISNVDSSGNLLDIEEQIFEDAPSRARRIPRSGDTILSTVRTYLKAIAYLENIPGNLIVSTGFAVLEPIQSINSKYLFYSTSSEVFIQNVIAYSKGVAYPAINPPELGQIPIIMPTLPEQTTIVNFLDNATAKIDKTIKLIEQKVNLLQEYKKSLIHHVVTGKVDVRGVE